MKEMFLLLIILIILSSIVAPDCDHTYQFICKERIK